MMNGERRQHSLTDDDIERIRVAISEAIHQCSFTHRELETLKGLAGGVNKTQKIASYMIIASLVGATIGGIGKAVYYYLVEVFIKGGGQ
jgi:hypothetical protein